MRLSEMGFEPATLACLHRGGINTTYRLLDHTYRELIWHSEVTPEALYDILRALRRHGLTLKATTKGKTPTPRASAISRSSDCAWWRAADSRKPASESASASSVCAKCSSSTSACGENRQSSKPATTSAEAGRPNE